MATHDYVISNACAAVRSDILNNVLVRSSATTAQFNDLQTHLHICGGQMVQRSEDSQ